MSTDEAQLDPDKVERDVLSWVASLHELTVLEEICTTLELEIPNTVEGNINKVLKFLLRHLNSQELVDKEDNGLSVFLKIYSAIPPKQEIIDIIPENESPPIDIAAVKQTVVGGNLGKEKHTIDILKLKDLKINGTIGGPEKKDSLNYSSLLYQINNGRKLGYSDQVVCAAVLKAISPGNNLRTYLESKRDLSVDILLEVMRSHFHEKDSSTVFAELGNSVQGLNENCLEFVVRSMLVLRQKVIDLGEREGCPYDEKLVQTRFLRTLEVGIRNDNIRGELRSILCNVKISDSVLMKAVTDAVDHESERSNKLALKKRETNIYELEVEKNETKITEKRKKDNHLQLQIQEIKLTQEKELSAMRSDLHEIRSLLSGSRNFGNPEHETRGNRNNYGDENRNNYGDENRNYRGEKGNYNRRRIFKCTNCVKNKVFRCSHCFKCGSEEHRMRDCKIELEKSKNGN